MTDQETMWERFKLLAGFSSKNNALSEIDPNTRTSKCASGRQLEILLIDVSWSMDEKDYKPSRLDGAKKAISAFLVRLREAAPESPVGGVSFSGYANVVWRPMPVGENMSRIEAKVKGLTTHSATNIASGLKLAGKMIGKCLATRGARILLLTDGHANEGGNPEPVAERLKQQGIQLDIIGIGGSPKEVNEAQLRKMASVVDNELRYWFIENVPTLVKKFEALALREVK